MFPLTDSLRLSPVCHQCVTKMLAAYLSQFSALADNNINCGPVLTWMEVAFHQHVLRIELPPPKGQKALSHPSMSDVPHRTQR